MIEVSGITPQAIVRPAVTRIVIVLFAVVTIVWAAAYMGLIGFGLAALVGLVGLVWLVLAPAATALGALLLMRAVTDGFAGQAIIFGLNPGALVGLGVIGVAGARLALEPRRRGMFPAAMAILFIFVWTIVAYGRFGLDESIVREVVRSLSLVAIALVAANHRGTLSYTRLADIVLIAALVPALVSIWEGLLGISQLTEATFRVQGTLAHSNSAAMFFSVALVLAAWRWAYAGGGRRYLFAMGLLLVAILLTKSIGGLGQGVVGLLVLGLLPRRGGNNTAIGLLAIGVVLFFMVDPLGLSRVGEISQTNFSAADGRDINNSLDWRFVNYREFITYWWDRSPLVGVGFGTTTDLVQPFGELPHSEPIRWLVETGLIGFAILSATFFALVNALTVRFRRSGNGPFFAALLGIVAGLAVHGLITHVSLTTAPMVLATAILAAGITLADGEDARQPGGRGVVVRSAPGVARPASAPSR